MMVIQQWRHLAMTQWTTRLVLSMSAFLVLIITTEECFEVVDPKFWSFGKSSFREIEFFGKSSFRNEKFGGLISKHKKELQSLGERITEFYNRTSRASVAYQNITDSCLSMPPNFMDRSFEFVNAHFAMITADVNLAYMSYSENSTVGKLRLSNFRYTGG